MAILPLVAHMTCNAILIIPVLYLHSLYPFCDMRILLLTASRPTDNEAGRRESVLGERVAYQGKCRVEGVERENGNNLITLHAI